MARGAISAGGRRAPGAAYLEAHRRAAHDGLAHVRSNWLAAGLSMAVMALALGLPAVLLALLDNQRLLVAEWGGVPSLSVFVHKQVDENGARALAERITAEHDVAAVELVSSERAFAEFIASMGLTGADAPAENPLPHVLTITLPADAWQTTASSQLVDILEGYDAVEAVLVDFAWIDRLQAIGELAARGLWVLGGLLLGAAVLIVGNTMRTLVAAQATEIEVLKLVGATNAYVRRPFLYSGALHGLLAGLLAALMVVVVFLLLRAPVGAVAAAYDSSFQLALPTLGLLLAVLVSGAVIGWSGAWLGTFHSLKKFAPGQIF